MTIFLKHLEKMFSLFPIKFINRSNLKRFAVLIALLLSIAACATTPWNQEQADSHLNIGRAYLGSERYNEALKEFLQAEKFAPRDPKVHYYMGASYYMKGMSDKATDEFIKALSYDSNYSEAHNFLGTVYLEKGLWDKAIESLKHALSDTLYDTPDKALFNMGRAYHGKGDYRMALNKYHEAKNTRPNTVPSVVIEQHMGMAGFAQGNMEEAVSHFKKALEIVPSFTEIHYWLGRCYVKLNNLEGARTEFRHIIKAVPESELAAEARKALNSIGASQQRP
jgi:tetratricopeptide (TPR) repeat protein